MLSDKYILLSIHEQAEQRITALEQGIQEFLVKYTQVKEAIPKAIDRALNDTGEISDVPSLDPELDRLRALVTHD